MRIVGVWRHSFFVAYLLTFVCYGSHLPGEEGSIDRRHNLPGSPLSGRNLARIEAARRAMRQPSFEMDMTARSIVLRTLGEVCQHREWQLLAAHVRIEHVHVVVDCDVPPEVALNAFKSYASRALNAVAQTPGRCRWARHGSTRYLWTRDEIDAAVRYVVVKTG